MQLRLDNIEEVVEPVIVQRGKKYFRSGCVTECTDEDGFVEAVVEGSELYDVSMEVDADGVVHSHRCSCPYDWGDVCKHEVAVMYYLREQRKAAARKTKVADVLTELKNKVKSLKAGQGDDKDKKKNQLPEAQNKLPDELFAQLPEDELGRRIMALSIIHNGYIFGGYITRIAKASQLTKGSVLNRLKELCRRGFLQQGDYSDKYILTPIYTLPLAMYILDRHPEWLIAETYAIGTLNKDAKIFWDICSAVYTNDSEALTQCRPYDWEIVGFEALIPCFFQPFYEPVLQTLPDDELYLAATNTLNQLELEDLINEENLAKVHHGVDSYRKQTKSSDGFFEDHYAFLRYLSGGPLPVANKYSSEWAFIAQAISELRQGHLKNAGSLFDAAHKIRNKRSKDKNLFYDTVANYFLMVYYAKADTPEARKKVQQFLNKEISRSSLQLPAYIVAKYIVLQDDENLSDAIEQMKGSGYPLLRAFARLFADFFHIDGFQDIQPPKLKLLTEEPVLFSIKMQNRWEKALNELMNLMPNQPSEARIQKPVKQARLAYVIERYDDEVSICPMKQKACKDGSWSKPYNVSTQTYFTTGYDFMDDVDRALYDHLRKIMHHTKYYYHPYWGTLADFLPYLVDTDKVLLMKSERDYEQVSVRKERAYLNIEHKGNHLVFTSNIHVSKNDLPLGAVHVVEESPTSYLIVELSDYERKAFETLLMMKSIPEEAEPKLKQFISAVSNHLEIHSDLIEGGSMLDKMAGDTTLVIRLSPYKGEFQLECCVQPLTGGKLRFFPGEGKTPIFDEKDGTRYQVERDLKAEQERLQTLSEFTSDQLQLVLTSEPQLIGIEDVLKLMEFVDKSDDYAIEWPDGAKLNIRQPVNADSYSMGLRSRENWFEVEGDLQLDEKTILSAAELLRLMQANMVGKRFVRLNDSEFIALNERLAKQLNRIRQLAQTNRNRVVIPRFEIGLLGELLSRPDSILQQDDGIRQLLSRIDRAAQMTFPVLKNLQATLRDYQEEGYRWMMRLAEWGAGACLADDMGLGKTIQTIAVLLAKAAQGPALVVAPASVVYNWQSELQRFAPTLKVHIFNEADNRQQLIDSMGAYDVLLTTYGLLVREEKGLTDKAWNVVCLDEAHTIKNRSTKMSQASMGLRANMRIALTGTPLQNYLSELWTLFRFINPGLLGSFETFSHDFITPIEVEHNKEKQVLLRKILQPFLLRRTKAEVIDELPDKTEITRRIELTSDERIAYEALRIEAQQQLAEATQVDMNVLASITRLRQAACSLELVQNGASLSNSGGSKLTDFAELISQIVTGGNRVLVFSQFTSFLRMAMNAISSEAYKPSNGEAYKLLYLDGSTPLAKRKQMVEAFQHGEAQVFFISLKAGGLGLNLTGANYVVHLDPWWNPAIEQQATDRAYRIGQKRNVTVYHLIAADTIEEKILRLHKTKRDLADALLQDQQTAHTLTLADLKELLAV